MSSTVTPKRGGTNYMGPFVGGAAQLPDYTLASTSLFRSVSQIRNAKALAATEQTLHTRRDDVTVPKFNGRLDTDTTSLATTEINKTEFEDSLRSLIKRFGLQTFFHVPDSSGTSMVYLVDHSHKVTLSHVIHEHSSRLVEPSPVYELEADGTTSSRETTASQLARFRCYDMYELNDIQLSRLIVDSLISSPLRSQVTTRYKHDPDFEDYPGSVYLMMILEVVNASTSMDIASATKAFGSLTLSSYPGENISSFATEALRLIHIMECGYALPYQLGSQLLEKVHQTQSVYFNMQVQNMLHDARTMENSLGPVGNPKDLEKHAMYSTRGPIGLCAALQKLYSELIKSDSWPALADRIPEGNYTPAPSRGHGSNAPPGDDSDAGGL